MRVWPIAYAHNRGCKMRKREAGLRPRAMEAVRIGSYEDCEPAPLVHPQNMASFGLETRAK